MPVVMAVLLLVGYFSYRPWENLFQLLEARTQLLTAMIVMELTVAVSMRSFRYPVFKVGIFKNKFLWYAILSSFALQLFILYTPGVQALFDVHMPDVIDWAIAALFSAIVFSIMEVGKYVASQRRRDSGDQKG
jgi:Ca2+-transporting ATPase